MDPTSTSFGYQLDQLGQFLMTPAGMVSIVLGPMLMAWAIAHRPARWIILAVLLWIATYGVHAPSPWFKGELLFPFQQIRGLGKALVIAGALILLPVSFLSPTGPHRRRPTATAVAYYAFLLLITFRLVAAGGLDRGLMQFVVYTLTFLVFGIGLSQWTQSDADCRRVIKCIVWAVVMLTVTSLFHVAVDSRRVIHMDRLFGTTSNPQFMGSIMGLSITPALFLLLESKESKMWRLFLCGAIGFMLACLVWSGSRTAALLTLTSLVLFFRLRLGRMILGIVVAALSLWLAAQFFAESIVGAERMFSTNDTRSAVWAIMWQNFRNHPFLGAAAEGGGYQESSYLAVLSQFGIFGGIPFLVMMILCGRMMLQLMRRRSMMGRDGTLADLVIAGMGGLGVACMFDSYALAMINFHILYFFAFQAMGGMLLYFYNVNAIPAYRVEEPNVEQMLIQQDPGWSL